MKFALATCAYNRSSLKFLNVYYYTYTIYYLKLQIEGCAFNKPLRHAPPTRACNVCTFKFLNQYYTYAFYYLRSQIEGVSSHRVHNPIKSKSMLAIYALISCTLRVTGIIMFFAPTLGLLDLLRHLQGSQDLNIES